MESTILQNINFVRPREHKNYMPTTLSGSKQTSEPGPCECLCLHLIVTKPCDLKYPIARYIIIPKITLCFELLAVQHDAKSNTVIPHHIAVNLLHPQYTVDFSGLCMLIYIALLSISQVSVANRYSYFSY